ncbi:unnamed protein product [Pleuronectes platessa]|uniref:Uncharacterized protein n=1 Tax=Pleuronectes platessa TaxID=8262 RepID=A0A9N7UJT2_PLEPL|nr:unnamed protein product [Pleuronectes platessa]
MPDPRQLREGLQRGGQSPDVCGARTTTSISTFSRTKELIVDLQEERRRRTRSPSTRLERDSIRKTFRLWSLHMDLQDTAPGFRDSFIPRT